VKLYGKIGANVLANVSEIYTKEKFPDSLVLK